MKSEQANKQDLAIQAMRWNDVEKLKAAIKKGADVNLTFNGSKPDYSAGYGFMHLSIVDRSVIYALDNKDKNCLDFLQTLEENGANMKFSLGKFADPDKLFDSKNEILMGMLIEKCPMEFQEWIDNLDISKISDLKNKEMLEFLLKNGLDVNKRDDQGRTALMLSRHPQVSHVLLQANPDLYTVDKNGKSAFWYATTYALKKIKINHLGTPQVPFQYVSVLVKLAEYADLKHDPHAISLSRRLARQLDKGLEAINNPLVIAGAFQLIKPQVAEVVAMDRKKRLERHMKGQGKRRKQEAIKHSLKM